MYEKNKSDLHCHLNGSFSPEFLKKTAIKNGCLDIYNQFEALRKEYLDSSKEQPAPGYPLELINKIWELFGLIHKIVQNMDDIKEGTIDAVLHSEAKYLEIRTTPKAMAGQTRDAYIDAFENGLLAVQANSEIQKRAYGLLSLDRTLHSVDDAQHFIDRILESKNGILIGLDISGNPYGERKLTGSSLAQVITKALEKKVPIAIHMGEADTLIERQDTDAVLNALEQWKTAQSDTGSNLFLGKVRLGHCIYLTPEQKEKIRILGLPIEVCPTCHKKLNWHLENMEHPVASIYSEVSENLVVGTDDDTVFGGSMNNEYAEFLRFFKNSGELSRKELKEHQANFRFCR